MLCLRVGGKARHQTRASLATDDPSFWECYKRHKFTNKRRRILGEMSNSLKPLPVMGGGCATWGLKRLDLSGLRTKICRTLYGENATHRGLSQERERWVLSVARFQTRQLCNEWTLSWIKSIRLHLAY